MGAVAFPTALAQSAVVIPVPEAEGVVSGHRGRLDRAAALGVPAHVTVIFPFVAPAEMNAGVVAALAAAAGAVGAFECEFPATGWFGQDVLWLAPRPAGPFRALTHAVMAAFPGCLPYGGVHSDVVPHLTIGDRPAGSVAALRAAEADVLRSLPIRAHISRVWLMTGNAAPGSWQTIAEVPLRQQ